MKIRNIILPVAVASIWVGNARWSVPRRSLQQRNIGEFHREDFRCFIGRRRHPDYRCGDCVYDVCRLSVGEEDFGKTDDTDIMEEISDINLDHIDKTKIILFCSIFGQTILLFVTGGVDIGTAALFGAILCIATGCIKQKEVFEKMNWNVIIWLGFVIASSMPWT